MTEIGFRKSSYKDRKDRRKKEFEIERTKITEEDVQRNLGRVRSGRSLDIPLIYLNGKLKKKFGGRDWVKKNRIRSSAYNSFWTYENEKGVRKLNKKVKWCLWFLYYYSKYVERREK